MAKPALGRGLRQLMKEPPASPHPDPASEKAPEVTPGIAALLRGGNGETKEKSAEHKLREDAERLAALTRKRKLVQISLLIADVLLIGLVARLALANHGHFGFLEVTLSVLAFAIGAWLSCLAFWLK